jgi:hypothetical protein
MTTTHEIPGNPSNGFAPETIARIFNDAADHSRAYVEKSLRTIQNETLELVNRRLDSNGTAISEYQNCKDFADLVNAQHKWFADLNRDYYDAWRRFSDVTQRLMADGMTHVRDEADEAEDMTATARRRSEAHESREAAE